MNRTALSCGSCAADKSGRPVRVTQADVGCANVEVAAIGSTETTTSTIGLCRKSFDSWCISKQLPRPVAETVVAFRELLSRNQNAKNSSRNMDIERTAPAFAHGLVFALPTRSNLTLDDVHFDRLESRRRGRPCSQVQIL
jgi:hypothetical protein